MFGSHLSIAGGMHNALLEAEKLGMNTVQVFTKNQQQWKCKPLDPQAIADWKRERERLGFTLTVSHDSYLINLASPAPKVLEASIALFVEELNRCIALEIPYLVTHPGAHLESGEEVGLKRVAKSLDEVHKQVPAGGVLTCLEITAGQGTSLGYKLEHLAEIISLSKSPERLAVCLDTGASTRRSESRLNRRLGSIA
jgi:deoxyribonuclease-4